MSAAGEYFHKEAGEEAAAGGGEVFAKAAVEGKKKEAAEKGQCRRFGGITVAEAGGSPPSPSHGGSRWYSVFQFPRQAAQPTAK